MDTLTPKQRSERMALVRGRDTQPERIVRSVLHSLGYRFRLQAATCQAIPTSCFGRVGASSSFTAASGTGTVAPTDVGFRSRAFRFGDQNWKATPSAIGARAAR
jgi:hypothetical protein